MKAVIIEDEKLAADRLMRILAKVSPEVEVTTVLSSVEDAVAYLSSHSPDLVFLDIHLSDGSSFEVFEQVEVSSPIIFTTAYHEYALKAFKVSSIDYLLKPIEESALVAALDKLKRLRGSGGEGFPKRDLNELILMIKNQSIAYRQRFLVAFGSKIKTIKAKDVAYFYATDKLVFLMENSGGRYVVDETLDQLQESLDPSFFFRANRAFILGVDAINQMYNYSRSRIKVELLPACDKECIVSTEKTPDFKYWLSR